MGTLNSIHSLTPRKPNCGEEIVDPHKAHAEEHF